MTTHLSIRLAWHDQGWNGCVCKNPNENTYCVGRHSFLGDIISVDRDLDFELSVCGQRACDIDQPLPCAPSINAFGGESIPVYSKPPSWFSDNTSQRNWMMPPYSVATWPYEEVYKDEVLNTSKKTPKYDPVKRRSAVNQYFSAIEPDSSLIFYYANYSNPFSENDMQQYVIIGMSRVKKIGEEITWLDQSSEMEEKYGPNVWLRNVVSHYPDEGLRIPYHAYLDQPEILEKILFVPDNARPFKYGTRHISDDGALGLIERMAEIVGVLKDMGDTHENWAVRLTWLNGLMAELWQSRGLYPGLLMALHYLKFSEAIPYAREKIIAGEEEKVKKELFRLIRGEGTSVSGFEYNPSDLAAVQKRWRLMSPANQELLSEVLVRFDLQTEQIEQIITHPERVSILSSPEEIIENPYILCESYTGMDVDDQVNFNQIDHGMVPSPELGQAALVPVDGWQRLRALCVEQLKHQNQHTFILAKNVLDRLNTKLSYMPDWKKAEYIQAHLQVEKEYMLEAITYRYESEDIYLYLKPVFEDERLVENVLRQLAKRPNIKLKFPMTIDNWRLYLFDSSSRMAGEFPEQYQAAIDSQIDVCQKIFNRPISVLSGSAGTGKTTVVSAIIQAVEKAHGSGTTFQLLAPTGKAADRLRERTGKSANTIHSFLAKRGWLNDNFTFKREGGSKEDTITTYIIDESSMLDLPLIATLFRSINWMSVQRLIFVGDPNQLPPIGTGRVFADLIDWLEIEQPEAVGKLTTNMRQIINQLTNQSTGIIDLASIFLRVDPTKEKDEEADIVEEEILARVIEGGDISGDLRILYWNNTDELEELLLDQIVKDMEEDTGQSLNPERPFELWNAVLRKGKQDYPEALQVISPYRGELFGTEHINAIIQRHKGGRLLDTKGSLGGITYFDKVIQNVNRPKSNPIWAYNSDSRKNEQIEVFNGEIGVTKVHGFDLKKVKWSGFRLQKFQVTYSQKPQYWVNFETEASVNENLELAYAISVHKSQGSEFNRLYFILPKNKRALLSRELFYTGITRAQAHCTILVEEDIKPILSLRRPESSYLNKINSSLFRFRPTPPELQKMGEWYEEGKIHRTLTKLMVRSKSEVIIANMLAERDIPYLYEAPLYAQDRTFYLPDFTLNLFGEQWYWEHLGMLSVPRYRSHWEKKKAWYEKNGFADNLITTSEENGFDSRGVLNLLNEKFGIE